MFKYFYDRIKKDFNKNDDLQLLLMVIGGVILLVFGWWLNAEIIYLIGFNQTIATILGLFALILEFLIFYIL